MASTSTTTDAAAAAAGFQRQWFEQALAQQRAAYEATLKMWSRLFAVPRVMDWARDVKVGTTPSDVAYEEDTLKLLHYRREAPAVYREPILICYALVNRPYIVDLQPDRSVVRQLLARGFEVYLIDWGVPSAADRSMTLTDYVDGLMRNCAEVVLKRHGAQALHLVGYCMGGTMSTIFAARNPDTVKTLTTMAAPIDFAAGADQTLVSFWSNPDYFDVDALVDAFGNVPATFLQASFAMMKPVQNFYGKYLTFFEKMDDDKFMENYFAMEKWSNDNIPVAGETFREFVKKLYQRNELARNAFTLGDSPVDLRRITCPVQILTATADHLVPPCQSDALKDLVGSKDVKLRGLSAGHIGLSVSSKAHKAFWPEVTQWLADRSGRVSY
ncbi:Poly-beta-hydroxybutyrate polymerase [Aquisphaera giovannonii]|uniref:Poly(3-hydroxyalkanoate) polymerase subunit PhaC n=1 Tax=Aquisphaera giovannonii TaxID=406548 RepID=A0A5B9W5B5_9BACT|nr:class III poly(R)-hydroxyalkanoic acid synthase subunit PhaC [Aquisphaera giovannonii]QEH35160.1 Poly-beta-hydroxybutyrate polymerase [Aquisphaera giovannonii]